MKTTKQLTVTLTEKEHKLLSDFLSLDLDRIGFSDNEQYHLRKVYDKLNVPNVKAKKKASARTVFPVQIEAMTGDQFIKKQMNKMK
jgi:hypothetical protein